MTDRTKIADRDVGDTIRIESTIDFSLPFQDGSQPAEPEETSIEIRDFEGDVVEEGELERNDEGEFYYDWDTRGLSPGDYPVDIEAEQDGANEVDKGFIRLSCDQ